MDPSVSALSEQPSGTNLSEAPSGVSLVSDMPELSEAPSGTSMLSERPSDMSMLSERPSALSMLSEAPSATSFAPSAFYGEDIEAKAETEPAQPIKWLCCCQNTTGAFIFAIVQLILACIALSFSFQSVYETFVGDHPNYLDDIVRTSGFIGMIGALMMLIAPSVLMRMLRFVRPDLFLWWFLLTYIGFGLYFLGSVLELIQSHSMVSRWATLTGLAPSALLLIYVTFLNIGARKELVIEMEAVAWTETEEVDEEGEEEEEVESEEISGSGEDGASKV